MLKGLFGRLLTKSGAINEAVYTEYHCKVDSADGTSKHNQIFSTRQSARVYKRLLSENGHKVHIIQRKWDNGFIASEIEVW